MGENTEPKLDISKVYDCEVKIVHRGYKFLADNRYGAEFKLVFVDDDEIEYEKFEIFDKYYKGVDVQPKAEFGRNVSTPWTDLARDLGDALDNAKLMKRNLNKAGIMGIIYRGEDNEPTAIDDYMTHIYDRTKTMVVDYLKTFNNSKFIKSVVKADKEEDIIADHELTRIYKAQGMSFDEIKAIAHYIDGINKIDGDRTFEEKLESKISSPVYGITKMCHKMHVGKGTSVTCDGDKFPLEKLCQKAFWVKVGLTVPSVHITYSADGRANNIKIGINAYSIDVEEMLAEVDL